MTESNLVQLKIIVERAVRPIRASLACKRKMREELLAHVSGAFEEELARVQDEHAALERTRVRFGNPTEMVNELQDSVRISDRVWRFWEGRPGESALRFALRYVSTQAAVALAIFGAVLAAAGWDRAWTHEEVIAVCSPLVSLLPVFVGLTLFLCAMEKALREARHLTAAPRAGWKKSLVLAWSTPTVRRAMIIGGAAQFLLFMAIYIASNWPARPWVKDHLISIVDTVPAMAFKAGLCVFAGLIMVWPAVERRRHHEEWASLPVEPAS
ncbi:MAG TPA: hypothetical protein VG826_18875 [Pirellulales bacterium]|nr:hypothetical protein [Pirellulales bacterium]